jgi:putative ABC transport system substrate-binding protein
MSIARLTMAIAFAVVAAALPSTAWEMARVPRIGYLGNSSPELEAELVAAFRQGLRDLGWVEGYTPVIEYRWAEGQYARFPELVTDLARLTVDVLVTAGTPGTLAAKRATHTIPIVMAVSGDPVGSGLVDSYARPGGNITGLTALVPALEGKRLELLKELVPELSRVAVLGNPANPVTAGIFEETQRAASALRVTLQLVEVRGIEAFEEVFDLITKVQPDALLLIADRALLVHRARLVALVAQSRLPAIYPYREFVDAGGMMSYAPNYPDLFRRAATFVDKILKGAKPADLPLEQPSKFELVINLKATKALSLTVPSSLLFQADAVIQ